MMSLPIKAEINNSSSPARGEGWVRWPKYYPLTFILSPGGEEIRRCALNFKECTFKLYLTYLEAAIQNRSGSSEPGSVRRAPSLRESVRREA